MTYRKRYILRLTIILTVLLAGCSAMAQVKIHRSVYGGGNQATVGKDTEVNISTGTIGTVTQGVYLGGATYGNVYGGGKGKVDDVNSGLVMGNTKITISGTPSIYHNVYGGGAYGSVGTFTYADATYHSSHPAVLVGMPYECAENTGKAQILITGGTIGTNGRDNGMVFGSSRGDIAAPTEIHDYLAWVGETDVVIGTVGTANTPQIKGSVYGSGENGHTFTDANVTIHGGIIGISSGDDEVVHDPEDPTNPQKDVTYAAYNYPSRGNVYGGGCGTDKYYSNTSGVANPNDGKGDTYNPLAGIVLGTTQVNIDGGLVVHNVYGAGAMGSVGTTDNTGAITGGGSTTVTISGGIVGVTVTVDNDHPEPTGGNVFGAARGDADYPERGVAQVKSTNVSMSNGTVYGNVYGGGESGDVGTYKNTYTPTNSKNYNWDTINDEEIGDCAVEITGGTVWGHVFGGGKGDAINTFECEKAIVRTTDVSISAGTVKKNVYGGGEVGRVDQNTKVTIGDKGADETGAGTSGAASAPVIEGDVFGAGAGKETHGYSALVRGNAEVIIQGNAEVGKSVYGGGEIAAVGRYGLDGDNMPTNLVSGGECKVTVKGYAKIGPVNGGNVVGAGKGVNPMDAAHNYINYTTLSDKTTKPKRMTLKPAPEKMPDLYDNVGDGSQYIWEYYTSEENYFKFLQTLALATDTKVSIEGNATVNGNIYGGSESGFVQRETDVKIQGACVIGTKDTDGNITTEGDIYGSGKGLSGFAEAGRVSGGTTVTINGGTTNGSVYGGGELGIVKGAVLVNVNDGTIEKDVYGGGALANTNTNNWNGSTLSETYLEVGGLTVGESSVVGYYEESSGSYTEVTSGTAATGKKYYRKVNTTVNLLGGEIHGDAYGGGLGQWGTGVHFTQEEINAATEGQPAYNKKTSDWKVKPADGTGNVKALVYGDVFVTLGTVKANAEDTNPTTATAFNIRLLNSGTEQKPNLVVNSGRVFGCNNLNGSPQGDVTVKVNKTVAGKLNGATNTRTPEAKRKLKEGDDGYVAHTYEVAAVYGGGNLADFTTTASGKKAWVRIETCDVSVEEVYGGGNAAAVPATDVLVRGAYEINEVFGGGNGKDKYTTDNGANWTTNPGANVNGNANTLLTGGLVHAAYGGSNEKGTITGNVTIDLGTGSVAEETNGACDLDVEVLVGAGKNADVNGDLIMVMGCKPDTYIPIVYGGANNANVNGDVELTITSGRFGKVFGGNNEGGAIMGHIILNIEETGECDVPIEIDELYLGGNNAAYSMYGYYQTGTDSNDKPIYTPRQSAEDSNPAFTGRKTAPYAQPVLNVISCTRIGRVYGGGFGPEATIYGNPIVNINMIPGSHSSAINREGIAAAHRLGAIGGKYKIGGEGEDIEGGVFGGGDGAKVVGNTTVNIGTAKTVTLTSIEDDNTTTDVDEKNPAVEGAYIVGNVYGGGREADVTGNTYVNICAVKDDDVDTNDVIEYSGVTISGTDFEGVTIKGDVFGGGKGVTENAGVTGAFECLKAMVGNNGDNDAEKNEAAGIDITKESTDKGTRVSIGNGTIEGIVYGGGEVGRVEWNGVVTIGLPVGSGETSQPEIKGDVFGGGKGVEQYGYAALMRGNTFVTVQANAKVGKSVYGGGEIASVGRYKVATEDDINNTTFMAAHPGIEQGMPYSLGNENSGYCNVIVRGNAEIGPNDMKMYYANGDAPDDEGHVFGAGKGVLPYENEDTFNCQASGHTGQKHPGRMSKGDVWECYEGYEAKYLRFIETQALATHTEVLIDENAFVKGSVYGGSLSGHVQHDTHVTITGDCQIGAGDGINQRYTDYYNVSEWPTDIQSLTTSWAECAHWTFDAASMPYDPYAKYSKTVNGKVRYYYDAECTEANYANGGSSVATDGHTYYGNVFGGGSGVIPYKPGKWHREAGTVGGNTVVDITGGHILTSVYGGNEHTDVGTYDPTTRALVAGTGKCTINMTGGTVGVPRTLTDIAAHPVTCYVFGAGKGDPRVNFNEWTNVGETQVNISGNARIYGSTFGGGEDGHVLGDAETNIGGTVKGTVHSNVIIGTQGLSGADGNVFGGGRGFSEEALTAGVVCGNVRVNIHNGTMLGSIFGGGRLASVGTHLAAEGTTNYGKLILDGKNQVIGSDDVTATGATHGHINVYIYGGTIGATDSDGKLVASDYSIGDVFGGCKGSGNNKHFGLAKKTMITMTAGTVNGNIYGGGELGYVGEATLNNNVYVWNEESAGGGLCTVGISGGTVKGNVFGAGKGLADDFECEKALVRTTSVTISGTDTEVGGNVYGGGEVGRVDQNTVVTVGSAGGTSSGTAAPAITGNVFGAGAGVETHGYSALVRNNAEVIVQGNATVGGSVYGGGKIAAVGRYRVDPITDMPTDLVSGGECKVTVKGYAKVGLVTGGNVFGAGMGVNPSDATHNFNYTDAMDPAGKPKRMTRYTDATAYPSTAMISATTGKATATTSKKTIWEYCYDYDENAETKYIWEYFTTQNGYLDFLQTLALATDTKVSIEGHATVNGSVYGGSESGFVQRWTDVKIKDQCEIGTNSTVGNIFGGGLGISNNEVAGRVRGNTTVTIIGGTTHGDVYGGGALGKVNTWTTTEGTPAVTTYPTATVNLLGGTITGDAFGGGRGDATTAADAGNTIVNLNGIDKSFYDAADATMKTVFDGLISKKDGVLAYPLNTTLTGCIVNRIFGANNVNGTPKGHVMVHVHATQNPDVSTYGTILDKSETEGEYDMTAVFGGGKQADYVPAATDNTEVIIDGCNLTSIETVYGGGFGASVPGTDVLITGTEIINEVFGGGYGKKDDEFPGNPGADVDNNTVIQLLAGKVNAIYGGSNTQGNIGGKSSITTLKTDDLGQTINACDKLEVGELYGGGKSAPMEGGAEIVLRCMPESWIGEVYAGAQSADVGNDVSLTITSGKFEHVFGGNNTTGEIDGYVEVNIEECPTCNTPVVIGELYGGGNEAPYTYSNLNNDPDYQSPRVNVRAFTSIGAIYGGGKGKGAVVTGNPTVYVNVGMVDGGGQDYNPDNDTNKPSSVKLYAHEKNKIGVIGDVFGGGNAAEVDGSTNVFIGTEKFVKLDRIVAGETNVSNYYIRTGTSPNYDYNAVPRTKATEAGTYYQREQTGSYTPVDVNAGDDISNYYIRSGEDPAYVYTPVSAAEDGKVYCLPVIGADIQGNVYGGGNAAKVTGNTNVVIGKEVTD